MGTGIGKFIIKTTRTRKRRFLSWQSKNSAGNNSSGKKPLDPNYASCAFQFSKQEIDDLAEETGFDVEAVTDRLDLQRRFVHFRKNSSRKAI